MKLLLVFLLLINAVSLLLMHLDKRHAQKQLVRIPERVLLSCALFGGSQGILLGMALFRHKTRTPRFSVGVPLILLLQLTVLLWLLTT